MRMNVSQRCGLMPRQYVLFNVMHPLSDVSDLARLVHNATHLDASSGRCYRFYCASSQNAVLIRLRMRIHTCFFFLYSFLFDLVVCVCFYGVVCVFLRPRASAEARGCEGG